MCKVEAAYCDSVRNTGNVFVSVKFYSRKFSLEYILVTHVRKSYLEEIAIFDAHGYAKVNCDSGNKYMSIFRNFDVYLHSCCRPNGVRTIVGTFEFTSK